jgi:hypothetical protein
MILATESKRNKKGFIELIHTLVRKQRDKEKDDTYCRINDEIWLLWGENSEKKQDKQPGEKNHERREIEKISLIKKEKKRANE